MKLEERVEQSAQLHLLEANSHLSCSAHFLVYFPGIIVSMFQIRETEAY